MVRTSVTRSGDVSEVASVGSEQSPEALRSLSAPTIASVLAIDIVGAVAAIWACATSTEPRPQHWLLFGLFTIGAFAHMALTRPEEERRRATRLERGEVEHVDQNAIFFAAAALVLPAPLALVLVVLVRARRYFIARKPPGLWISTTATVMLAVVGVGVVRDALHADLWLEHTITTDTTTGLHIALVMAASIAVYFLAEAVPIGIYRGIRNGRWRLRDTIGSREDNLLILETLLLAMATALVALVALPALAGMLAITVAGSRRVGRLAAAEAGREAATIDALTDAKTGLLNLRGFETLGGTALELDHASERPSALLMLDLDHFKSWNTRLGHPGGDKILKDIARVLRLHTRDGDVLARWGGEEFAVLLPGTGLPEATAIAERIRAAVQALDTQVTRPVGGATIRLGHNGIPQCTVSIGVAVALGPGQTLDALTAMADDANEQAKRQGRNLVIPAPGISHESHHEGIWRCPRVADSA